MVLARGEELMSANFCSFPQFPQFPAFSPQFVQFPRFPRNFRGLKASDINPPSPGCLDRPKHQRGRGWAPAGWFGAGPSPRRDVCGAALRRLAHVQGVAQTSI